MNDAETTAPGSWDTTYNVASGGGENFTRSSFDAYNRCQFSYGNCRLGWPEMGWNGDALQEVIAS
jgi:hypothetical protein